MPPARSGAAPADDPATSDTPAQIITATNVLEGTSMVSSSRVFVAVAAVRSQQYDSNVFRGNGVKR
jgi:hypothetical protein